MTEEKVKSDWIQYLKSELLPKKKRIRFCSGRKKAPKEAIKLYTSKWNEAQPVWFQSPHKGGGILKGEIFLTSAILLITTVGIMWNRSPWI